ncbi:MAG: hypothetical protein B6D58_08235 [candidate division Zixibacteria bacterium 4484_95]|nr:MAG: hypothetical protein B6D58_08235 [candidate division Zixibacteria bacterium 4484_95]RKX18091.1 MAG: hypothetical protein DRP26_05850 [candidate division Zixibacteria bacterium]
MKILILILAIIVCLNMPAFGITGLGFGLHAGMTNNYSYSILDDSLRAIAQNYPGLGIPDDIRFSEDLTSIGAHLKVGTLPIIDFYLFADYAWKKKELSSDIDLRLSDFSFGASAKKMFGFSILKPYLGAGVDMHNLVYTIEADSAGLILPVPDNQTKIGYHVVGGIELNFPILPLDPYAEYRHNWITTSEKVTKYGLFLLGLTFSI